jgi:YfiH family protein
VLQRITHPNGVVTWRSPLLHSIGVVHAFSTRIGGISSGPFAALNLGNPGEGEKDSEENLRENYRRLQEALGCAGVMRAWVRQVHGRNVELLEREPEGEYGETLEAEVRDRFSGQLAADAIVSAEPVLLTIRVADCVPVLLASGDGRIVGAAHAGWRGVAGNVAEKTIRAMREIGAREIIAAIGPAISRDNFEVGAEVAEEFGRQGLGAAVRQGAGGEKPHVDLQAAIRRQLERAGVARVDGNELCSYRDAGDFYSHRRDAGRTGRMAGVIMARVPAASLRGAD